MKIDGSCHCGNITYEAEVNSDNAMICHCTDCQRLSGSAFRSVIASDIDAFQFTSGVPKIYVKTGDNGNKREQTFCPDCGSPIYSTSVGTGPKVFGIRLGTVNQRELFTPSKQIWCSSAQQWTETIASISKLPKQ